MGNTYDQLSASLREISGLHPNISAVLMVTGHWEERAFAVASNSQPPMVYDYGGFPPHTFQIQYPAPGSPHLATQVKDLLGGAGLQANLNDKRGFDHGVFVPMYVMYPNADMPVVMLSLWRDLDVVAHLAAGRALTSLREQGVLIIGSGSSYHNLRDFGPGAKTVSAQFDAWLSESVCNFNGSERNQRLLNWKTAPAAQAAHPREEHLMPLMVAAGAAENEVAVRNYHEDNFFGGISISGFKFG